MDNLYGWAMSQKLPVNGFEQVKKLSKFDECFIKNYYEESNKGYFLEVDVEYPKNLFSLHSDLPFLPETSKIKYCNKLVRSVRDNKNFRDNKNKNKNFIHINALKQAPNLGIILKKCIQ